MGNGDGRAVVVTGASTGIGQACALHLDRKGFRVFAGVRKPADGDALRAGASDRFTTLFLDVTDPSSIAAAADRVSSAVGPIGLAGLVNNAGVAVAAPLEFVPIDELRRSLEVNVVGQIAVTQAFLPLLRAGRGRIVNMGSISGRIASALFGPYAASKFALEALTDTLRRELAPWGIEVVIVQPGNIATPIWHKTAAWSDEVRRILPRQAEELYGASMDGARRYAEKAPDVGLPAKQVALVVEHALTAPRPRTRYTIGRQAGIALFLIRSLPDRWLDRALRRVWVRRGT